MTQFIRDKAGADEASQKKALAYLFAQDSVGLATDGVLVGLAVSQTTTASASVNVAAGSAVSQDSVGNGAALMVNDTQQALDVLGANPMGGTPRNDLVVFDSATVSSGSGGLRVIVGTPNAVPSDPSVPATAVKLARIRNAASATTVPSSAIDGLRVFTRLAGVPLVQSGTVSLAGDGTNQRTAAVTFPTAFSSTPIIMLQELTGMSSSTTTQTTWPSLETATGFTCNVVRNNTTTVTVRWFAFLGA